MKFLYKDRNFEIKGRREHTFRELEIMNFILRNYNLSNIMIDCGANYGNHTIFFGAYSNLKKIHAFEPMPEIYTLLNENLLINKIDDLCISHNKAVSNKNKKVKLISEIQNTQGAFWFWYEGEKAIHPRDMGYGNHRYGTNKNIIAESIRLDDYLGNLEKVDFIKIDVEGMELEAMAGCKNIITNNRPLIYVETCRASVNKMNNWIAKNSYKKVVSREFFGHHWLLEPK